MTKKPKLYIVIPCYNEQEVLPTSSGMFLDELYALMKAGKIASDSRVMFVNDGSRDQTWDMIKALSEYDEHFIGISLSRNRGHQNALLGGLMEAKDLCDITISIDCDGQDDIKVMDDMVDAYLAGNEVVYGVRSSRETDTFFKRFTAESYYKLLNIMGADIIFNHADYRLVSSKVLQEFANFKEVNLFLRGLIPLVGYQSTSVYYERHERIAGESHYPLSKMLGLAFDGITSLSVRPIRMVTYMGTLISFVCFVSLIVKLIITLVSHPVAGWSWAMSVICFVLGLTIISIGVVGEYVGKIYLETKQRPRYIISDRTWEKEEANG